jgi:hypothetical protein
MVAGTGMRLRESDSMVVVTCAKFECLDNLKMHEQRVDAAGLQNPLYLHMCFVSDWCK